MLAIDSVDTFHRSVFDHGASALSSFLGGLEGKLYRSVQFILNVIEDVRGCQKHSGMRIMTAGMHRVCDGRLEGQVVLLGYGKSIHIGADKDGFAGLSALYSGEHAGLKTAMNVGHANFIKLGLNELAGFVFFSAEFGVHMQLTANVNNIIAVFFPDFVNIHFKPPCRHNIFF